MTRCQKVAVGVDILTISRRLGHGSPSIKLAVYGYLMLQADDNAARAIESALGTDVEQVDPVGGGNPVAIDGSGGPEGR